MGRFFFVRDVRTPHFPDIAAHGPCATQLRMRAWLFGFSVLAVACSSSSSRSSFGDDAGTAPSSSSPAPPPPGAGFDAGHEAGGSSCERDVSMGAISISNPSCFVNEHVSNKTAKLSFACAGGSDATIVFDGHTFTGTVNGDKIDLSDVEKFMFNNCQWESTERIQGDLATKTLTYSYSEKPVVSCPDTPCTASGTVTVSAGEVIVVN